MATVYEPIRVVNMFGAQNVEAVGMQYRAKAFARPEGINDTYMSTESYKLRRRLLLPSSFFPIINMLGVKHVEKDLFRGKFVLKFRFNAKNTENKMKNGEQMYADVLFK
ncbi:major facilitator superfamily protein [Striga asiatica]|uniref:Major facilitator superfamily protein n=1 Tax=Striga asiatica TaxID=4170 RepID=A0A5A7QCY1_STRAF|nr:major facilitator superfamily protein [Striga asiatica]